MLLFMWVKNLVIFIVKVFIVLFSLFKFFIIVVLFFKLFDCIFLVRF